MVADFGSGENGLGNGFCGRRPTGREAGPVVEVDNVQPAGGILDAFAAVDHQIQFSCPPGADLLKCSLYVDVFRKRWL